MSENKYCGNSKHFKDVDVNGEGFCEVTFENSPQEVELKLVKS